VIVFVFVEIYDFSPNNYNAISPFALRL